MILRLSSCGKELQLTLPKRSSEKAGMAFVNSQSAWILRQRAKFLSQHTFPLEPEAIIPLFGKDCLLRHETALRGAAYTGDELRLGGDVAYFSRRVQDWIKAEAKQRFGALALELASQLGQRPAAVTLRDTQSRWGSCSKARRISLSWRLAFAPEAVAYYVIAHEVVHLQHFDHSPAFWQTVAQLYPDWKSARDWLKRHGKMLHRYGST